MDLPETFLLVLKGYCALCPPRFLHFPANSPFYLVHEFCRDAILLNPHFSDFPPSGQYQVTFWKWAIQNLEELAVGEDDEIDERMYSHYTSLMAEAFSETCAPSASYATYLWRAGNCANAAVGPGIESATLLESRTLIESGTTGLRTWSASLVMAQHLLSHPELVRGKRVLELGSGAGFLGVVIASMQLRPSADEKTAGSPALYLTDANHSVLQRCRDNIYLPCNWSDAMDPLNLPAVRAFLTRTNADTIVGADLVFDPSIIPALVSTLQLALTVNTGRDTSTSAYIASTVRNEDTFAQFLQAARQSLAVEEVSLELEAPAEFMSAAEMSHEQQVKIFKMSMRYQYTGQAP